MAQKHLLLLLCLTVLAVSRFVTAALEDTTLQEVDVCVCSMESKPVCGVHNNVNRTFSNNCTRICAGYDFVRNDPCIPRSTRRASQAAANLASPSSSMTLPPELTSSPTLAPVFTPSLTSSPTLAPSFTPSPTPVYFHVLKFTAKTWLAVAPSWLNASCPSSDPKSVFVDIVTARYGAVGQRCAAPSADIVQFLKKAMYMRHTFVFPVTVNNLKLAVDPCRGIRKWLTFTAVCRSFSISPAPSPSP
mmetsp:Transcript_24110/g.39627  ORF Transcript_24110/g.39627 Transcript_24110/m.39627 type:complete len:246 (-) Transcript_24110:528-1265(-)